MIVKDGSGFWRFGRFLGGGLQLRADRIYFLLQGEILSILKGVIMEIALIGLIGVLLGIVLNEKLRRRNRIENYSTSVFEKRLNLYEELYKHVSDYSQVANEVIDNKQLTKEQRLDMVSAAILTVAEFCDEHELYLDDELTLHCCTVLMDVEDIQDIDDRGEREQEVKRFHESLRLTKGMIRKEAGIADINKLFKKVIKPKHSSATIEYYRELMKKNKMRSRWE